MIVPSWIIDAWAQLPMALLHTLWQGVLVMLVVWVVLRRIPATRPERRYGWCLAGLVLVVAGWLVTWSALVYLERAPETQAASAKATQDLTDRTARSDQTDRLTQTAETAAAEENGTGRGGEFPWRTWLADAWLAGVLVMALRTTILVRGAGRLRRGSVLCDDDGVRSVLDELRHALGVAGDVVLRVSDRIDGPMVMGILSPAILLPAYVMTGVPPEHLRAALAHELAHIRRYDYLVNLAQLLVETLLFFNPTVWWVSRQIRVEREACCDSLAIRCTGGAADYAHALAAFAAHTLSPSPTLAMSGTQPERTLLDRIRRILTPHDRPALRLPWYSLIGLFAVATALLAALGGFSYLGVKLFAEVMSPQERIERIEAIDRQFDETDPENDPEIAVSGTIHTENGEPLPEGLNVTGMNIYPGSGPYIAFACDVDGHDFHCERVKARNIYIWAIGDGYAPTFVGPYDGSDGKELTGIEVVLTRGFTGRLRVADEAGLPVSSVDVSWQFPTGLGVTKGITRTTRTEADGGATLEHCWDKPIALTLQKPGYIELYEPKFAVDPNEVTEIELRHMEPVEISLQDAITGAPVPDARLQVVSTRDLAQNSVWDRKFTLAVSDKSGVFTIDSIRDAMEYWCYITAPGKRRIKLDEPIMVGQAPRTITLPPPLAIRGTILVPKDDAGTYPDVVSLYAENPFSGGGYIESFGRKLEIPLKDGRGEFVVDDIWPGKVVLAVGDRRENLNVHESIDNYVIDLRPNRGEGTRTFRTVVLHFQVPEDHPVVTGRVRIHYLKHPGDNVYANAEVPIENGEARYDVTVPTRIGYDVLDSPGYWVKSDSSIPVPTGDAPYVIDVPTIPAGAIHGTVENAPDGHFGVSVVLVESPPGHDVFPIEARNKRKDGAYTTSPLPLGGTYIIFAHSNGAAALSEPVKLTEERPIREVDLAFADGVPVEGRVTYPDGTPVRGLHIVLSVVTRYSHGSGTEIGPTDMNGAFHVEHVNFDLPLTYIVELKPDKDYMAVRRVISRGEPVNIQLTRGLVLEGRVVDDATGYPVPGVEVYGTSTQPETSIVNADKRTDEDGRFLFSRLRDQVYSLGTRNGTQPVKSVDVAAGTDVPVEIRVKILPGSSVQARKN